MIVALCVAPVAASYVAYYFTPPAGHTNYGELVSAPPLPDATLHLAEGGTLRLNALRGKWVLLMADEAPCNDACQRKLFTLRQLRLAQGKDMDRIERLWLIRGEEAIAPQLAVDYRGTWFARAGASDVLQRLPAERSIDDYIYLIDPLGNVVLRYSQGADPGKIIKDMTRVLKSSRIG
jgi:hypothetical protein